MLQDRTPRVFISVTADARFMLLRYARLEGVFTQAFVNHEAQAELLRAAEVSYFFWTERKKTTLDAQNI